MNIVTGLVPEQIFLVGHTAKYIGAGWIDYSLKLLVDMIIRMYSKLSLDE